MTPREANIDRPLVLAVSNSDQHRETLAILLGRDFEVVLVADIEIEPTATDVPGAVVLAPTDWTAHLPYRAHSVFPAAPLVLLDAPATLTVAFPGCTTATWSDPFSVRAAVARALQKAPRGTAPAGLTAPLNLLEQEISRPLRVAQALSRLARLASLPGSSYLTRRILREQLDVLAERLAWVDLLAPVADDFAAERDLTAALRQVMAEKQIRLACRGLSVRWEAEKPCALRCTRGDSRLIVHCLAHDLLRLPSGAIIIFASDTSITCFHPSISLERRSFALLVAERALARAGGILDVQPGHVRVTVRRGTSG